MKRKRWYECGMETGTPEAARAVGRLTFWFIALSLVVVVLAEIVTRLLAKSEDIGPVAKGAISLIPVLPFAGMIWLFARTFRHLDELIKRIQADALACTLGVTVVVTVAWGQLQRAHLVPLVDMWAIWPAATLIYAPCLLLTRRRYR